MWHPSSAATIKVAAFNQVNTVSRLKVTGATPNAAF